MTNRAYNRTILTPEQMEDHVLHVLDQIASHGSPRTRIAVHDIWFDVLTTRRTRAPKVLAVLPNGVRLIAKL